MTAKLFLGSIFFGLIAYSSCVQAAVVMVDMNFSAREVAVAEASAKSRNENFILLPVLASDVRAKIDSLRADRERLNEKIMPFDLQIKNIFKISYIVGTYEYSQDLKQKLSAPEFASTLPEYQSIEQAKKPLQDAVNQKDLDLTSVIDGEADHQLNVDGLEKTIQGLESSGDHLTALIISGHHADDFYGDFGGHIRAEPLFDMLRKHTDQIATLKSVYLLACYSATEQSVAMWKSALPNLEMIAGWNFIAPSELRTVDTEFLKSMLMNEKQLLSETSPQKLLTFFKSIKDISSGSAAFLVGETYVSLAGAKALSYEPCPSNLVTSGLQAWSEYQKYLQADAAGYENVPDSTLSSPLRDAYSTIQKNANCIQLREAAAQIPQIIRLIHYKNISMNFASLYGSEISQTNTFLKSGGAPTDALFPDLNDSELTRAGQLRQIRAYSNFVSHFAPTAVSAVIKLSPFQMWLNRWSAPSPQPSPVINSNENAQIKLARELAIYANKILGECDCMDDLWMNPPSQKSNIRYPDYSCIHSG